MTNDKLHSRPDWVYLWILFAFGGIGRGICIILKASLRWAPIVGPASQVFLIFTLLFPRLTALPCFPNQAMQMFQFAFVSKMDPLQNSRIYPLAKQSVDHDRPFALLLFPEGTLISPSTRPKSAAFAKANDVVSRSSSFNAHHTRKLIHLASSSFFATPPSPPLPSSRI